MTDSTYAVAIINMISVSIVIVGHLPEQYHWFVAYIFSVAEWSWVRLMEHAEGIFKSSTRETLCIDFNFLAKNLIEGNKTNITWKWFEKIQNVNFCQTFQIM